MSQPPPQKNADLSLSIDWSSVRRVLLVRLRSIGDSVLMTPCLAALKDWRPAIEIGVVTEPLAAPVFEGHPLVDRSFVAGQSLGSRLRLLARIRRERFDLAVNLHGGSTGMLLAAMSGAKYKVGFRGQQGSWLLNKRAPSPDIILGRDVIHSVEQQLSLLQWAGVPMPVLPRLALAIHSASAASLRTKLQNAGLTSPALTSSRFAIVAPGAAFESKRWSARGFAQVIDHMRSRWQLESIIVAGPGQEPLAREIAGSASTNPYVLSQVSLAELMALIAIFGRVFVGNDSGPMHIAAAVDCPVVAVFGSSDPNVWHPWTEAPYRVLGGERGTGDNDRRGSIEKVEAYEVIASVDEVLQSAATQAAS
ncbi:MAG TPA: glycosyltransferase family 9 protein [Blastocatellia bacterium]|nr:glycosyltransferase family 9 protein [Blastocatellia bacterium]